jgi:hypothetical protein
MFCCVEISEKYLHIRIINQLYAKYRTLQTKIHKKYNTPVSVGEYNAMKEEEKDEYNNSIKEWFELRDKIIDYLLLFCRNYPQESVAEYPHIKTYELYPYRLHQNLADAIDELNS